MRSFVFHHPSFFGKIEILQKSRALLIGNSLKLPSVLLLLFRFDRLGRTANMI